MANFEPIEGPFKAQKKSPTIQTVTLDMAIEQHDHSWDLLFIDRKSNTVGVGAFGPIESLPVILGILEKAGVKVRKQNPKLKVVGD